MDDHQRSQVLDTDHAQYGHASVSKYGSKYEITIKREEDFTAIMSCLSEVGERAVEYLAVLPVDSDEDLQHRAESMTVPAPYTDKDEYALVRGDDPQWDDLARRWNAITVMTLVARVDQAVKAYAATAAVESAPSVNAPAHTRHGNAWGTSEDGDEHYQVVVRRETGDTALVWTHAHSAGTNSLGAVRIGIGADLQELASRVAQDPARYPCYQRADDSQHETGNEPARDRAWNDLACRWNDAVFAAAVHMKVDFQTECLDCLPKRRTTRAQAAQTTVERIDFGFVHGTGGLASPRNVEIVRESGKCALACFDAAGDLERFAEVPVTEGQDLQSLALELQKNKAGLVASSRNCVVGSALSARWESAMALHRSARESAAYFPTAEPAGAAAQSPGL